MCTWLVRAKFSPVAIPPETIRALQQLSPPQSIGSVESGIFLWRILADDANSAIYYDPHKWPNGPFIDKEI